MEDYEYGYRDTSGMVQSEAGSAFRKFGHFTSAHEAYGVLAEEVAELLEAIRANDERAIHDEAIQVSAVAMRLASEIRCVPAMRKRSGCE